MVQTNYNPDVLSCLASLSNDEVFTPPSLANQILDLLPASIWRDKNAMFLDPVSKSGVFLREITKRLMMGLEKEIPDPQKRANHIYTKQVFGIAITELTSLLSRRTLYCSKLANGEYSVCDGFDDEKGNVIFQKLKHTWQNGRCTFCGASQEIYERDRSLESHAYQFIHTEDPRELLNNMKFDVIIGNPPYQLNDGGGTGSSAVPIYDKFVTQAKKLNPTYLSMIIPARWFTGGRGVDEFRDEMLNDDQIRVIHDFPNASDCFPGVEIKGGVCYFLWQKGTHGKCKVYTHRGDQVVSEAERQLLEKGSDTFIRYNEAIPILRKIQRLKEESFSNLISANDPFGFDVRVDNSYKRVKPKFKYQPFKGSVELFYYGWEREGIGYIEKSQILKNQSWVNDFKVYITKAYGAGEVFPHQILNRPMLGKPNSCCTETYLVIGPFKSKKVAESVIKYIETKFFRFLVLLIKNTQNAMKKVYSFVPSQDFSEEWTDVKLYKKYGLTKGEIDFIENMIKPMSKEDE